jgi:catechol 2,3-dioxygenase-like lactoylglutathione lyase family enzyme
MAVELNHTIVNAHDRKASAEFLAGLLGLEVGEPAGVFLPVVLSNGVTLDFMNRPAERIESQHYAFLISEEEFDEIFGRITEAGLTYWADPGHQEEGKIGTRWGGRGVYFADPNGHNMEILTRTP